ncbi:MAG: hypothetical protein H5U32_03660 [Pseudomonas balearica]|uniref:hypothetical protein n=1 Tax=Stutzerimonas balearica TaxID=74829 RepID=UPI0019C3CF95|nr:hypothetical protein [Stutzerimonas balearica]MBC7198327.1 hypothetical protein [Stutzerimonas balearica]
MSELFERKAKTFGYYINLDERGSFDADLRDMDDKSLMTVSNEEQDGEGNVVQGEIGLVEAGYMKHGRDIDGLASYAIQMGIIPAGSVVLNSRDFEAAQEELFDDWQACLKVLDQYDPESIVGQLYEEEEVADALEKLINDFNLEQWSNMTIGQIVRMANGEEATQEASKSKAMRFG